MTQQSAPHNNRPTGDTRSYASHDRYQDRRNYDQESWRKVSPWRQSCGNNDYYYERKIEWCPYCNELNHRKDSCPNGQMIRCDFCGDFGLNSLAPGEFEWNFIRVIFKQILIIDEIALIWMSLDFTDDQSTLVQVMAWCRQAISHYPSQCWPRSLSPYGVIRPQWVKAIQHPYTGQ